MTLEQSTQIMNDTSSLLFILALALLAFGIWAFADMLMTSKSKLKKTEKGIWSIAFIAFLPLTAIVWSFVRK